MATKQPAYSAATPAMVIDGAEVEEMMAPFVFEVAGEKYALRSGASYSIEELDDTLSTVDHDIAGAVGKIAADDRTAKWIRSASQVIVKRVLNAWVDSLDVSVGESEHSGN